MHYGKGGVRYRMTKAHNVFTCECYGRSRERESYSVRVQVFVQSLTSINLHECVYVYKIKGKVPVSCAFNG